MIDALLDLANIIAALGGGAFGAAFGPLPAFCFTGLLVIAGEASVLAGGDGLITNQIAFGPAFSPAVSFGGGVAATAYAARRGYMDDFEYDFHQGKNIAQALGTKPDVLVVGAVFGVIGWWLQTASGELALPYDPIAMGVVLSAVVHRLVFGYSIIGKVRGSNVLDMSPFEHEERRTTADGGEVIRPDSDADTSADSTVKSDRLAVEPWLPHQYRWGHVATLGAFVGILGGWISIATQSPFLGFGISAASLLFLNLGVEKVPVTHHITLPAGTAALAVMAGGDAVIAGLGQSGALIVALIFGVLCALFGELFQRVFYAHGDTHFDPPAAAIVFGTVLIALLHFAGIFPDTSWLPTL